MITARDFSPDEIKEISRYALANMPYTETNNLLLLSNDVIDLTIILITLHDLYHSCSHYVKDDKTKEKLLSMVAETDYLYNILFPLFFEYKSSGIGKSIILEKLKRVILNWENKKRINNLRNAYIIFTEKLVFLDINKVSGVREEDKEGRSIVDSIYDFMK